MGMVERQMRAQYFALRAGAGAAREYFEKHSDFPATQVAIEDGIANLKREVSPSALSNATPERFKLVTDVLDIRAEAYLRLVEDMGSQKAYETLLAAFGLKAIEDYTGYSGAEIHFAGDTHSERQIVARVRHWTTEGYRKLARKKSETVETSPASQPPSQRRGYRAEVRAWMTTKKLETIPEAAKALGLSETTLKSIMSDAGEQRYSQETLDRVLKTILPKR